ncbi:TetR/AcrR family transcriptional regulator [Planococcus lenghuensis]|uniref:TetR family transcriptional regulator n=1 Tax=Planococcus lenghuensis TaxID=2213202 RepID=A0A1Q2KUM1_9BACL|nr:TetR/AcrR family transcriptional regulator [Planococcus lenghuensis]AQQ51843.1 TetR family transcriptional regulator [Planococcus lenghuensis]
MGKILDKFESLEPDKQQRILAAALAEFAENGFAQASTNRIVKAAEVGKGILFYYFQSKKGLYEYLVNYSLDVMLEHYLKRIDETEPDFIERLRQAAQAKMETYIKYRHVFSFMATVMLQKDSALPAHLETRLGEMTALAYEKLYSGIDRNRFRAGIDVEKAFQLIRWSIEGYQNDLTKQLEGKKLSEIDLNPYWEEFYGYLDVLKESFYEKGDRT